MTGERRSDAAGAPSGAVFWLFTAVGAAIVAFGAWGLVSNLQGPALASWLKTFAGGLLVHDALFVPLVIAGSVLLVRVVPGRVRAPVQGALIVSGALVAVAIPVVGGFGRLATNPSLLPSHHYAARLLVVLGIVWVIAAVVAVVGRRRSAGRQLAR